MYCRRYKKCCMQNNYDETMVQNTCKMCGTTADYYAQNNNNNVLGMNKSCECGFDHEESVFPENPVLGQSYVPIQKINKTFVPCVRIKNGNYIS